MPFKILLFSHRFFPDIGGIESISEMLANEFINQGHEVHIATWSNPSADKKFAYKIINRPKVATLFREIHWADIVFENNPCLRMSWPNLFFKKPLVTGLQTWIEKPDGSSGIQEKLKLKWLKLADKVIACSNAIRANTFQKAITIGNPYDNHLFRRLAEIPKTKDYVFLGRLVSDKGAKLAISAFHKILQNKLITNSDSSTLTIIGSGEELPALQQQVANLNLKDKILFIGSKRGEELVRILNEHRYLLVPSLWKEPFGIVALEGMACGCISIVSDGGGLPDAVGQAGLIFKRGDVNSLVSCMVAATKDERFNKDFEKATHNQLRVHQAKNVAYRYLELITGAVESKKKL